MALRFGKGFRLKSSYIHTEFDSETESDSEKRIMKNFYNSANIRITKKCCSMWEHSMKREI